ncbi:MAG: hypothetical protein P8X97_06285 [Candidatus Bathyarchaeota archaeon]|jgi:hypothetical protein
MSKNLDIAAGLIAIVDIIGIIYALQDFLVPIDEALLGVTVTQIRAFNPNVLNQITLLFQFTGLYMFGTTSMAAIIALLPYRKGEKWAWYTQLVIGGIALIGQLVIVYIAGNLLPSYMLPFNIVLIILWLIGIILPVKEFFS